MALTENETEMIDKSLDLSNALLEADNDQHRALGAIVKALVAMVAMREPEAMARLVSSNADGSKG